MKVLVCDVGPIIHLMEIQKMHLLLNMGEIYISYAVKLEVESHIQSVPDSLVMIKLESEDYEEAERIMKHARLHKGEAESIILAKRINADMVLTDDSAARFYASINNIEVHGSLGIVLWNYFNEIIGKEETRNILYQLKTSSLWITNAVFQKALDSLEK